MCGIAGIYAYHSAANPVDRQELIRIRDYMSARGPDGRGEWYSQGERVGFGHRRLSIIDCTDAGAQPMASADGRFIVTFNGEIYNYRELRTALEVRGRVFRSQSDTEVLLHLYAEKGEAMVHDLRGMFAFAIWDGQRQCLFLARDPYGIKPLYYSDDGWSVRFASQVKALLAGGRCSREPDPAGRVGFYIFGNIPEPYTSCSAIRALPAGTTMQVDHLGARSPKCYFSIAETYHSLTRGSWGDQCAKPEEEIRAALLDSVRHHLVADVPVGAFLSAGINSGALVGLMRDAGQNDIQTVTIAFEEFRGRIEDEAPFAERTARQYGTRHCSRIITEREFLDDLPKILAAMDLPSVDGINTWFVSKAANELGLKVAISGLGGDELFGGYPSFRQIPRWVRALAVPHRIPFLGKAVRIAAARVDLARFGLHPKIAGLLEYGGRYPGAYLLRRAVYMPWEISGLLPRELAVEGLRRLAVTRHIANLLQPNPGSAFAKVAILELALYMRNQLLRDTDWASMAHSLEVRVPLVDHMLLQRVAREMSTAKLDGTKELLALSPKIPLPPAIIGRAKTGFATPIASWSAKVEKTRRAEHQTHASKASRLWAQVVAPI